MIFELSGVLYLYRDFVTVLAKIAAAVSLMDKIKKKNPQKLMKQTNEEKIGNSVGF